MAKEQKKHDALIIGGFGHVGLPLGIVLADSGITTALYDINTAVRPTIEAGTMPFIEYDAEPILKKVIGKSLTISDDIADVAHASNIIITIGTPVDEYLSPKMGSLFALADSLMPHLNDDHCLILRSTLFPGASEMLHEHFKKHKKNVHIAFCPERIVQGYAIRELRTLPQIVSGFSDEAVARSVELFKSIGVETVEIEPEEAELSKLFLNAWRYLQFAAANQFYMIAKDRKLDYNRILHAMKYNYDRARDLPGPGFAAGPCLFKDTMQLAAANRSQFLLGHAAMMVNEGLPKFVIDSLREDGVELRGKTVGILGMAFKSEIDDTRDSLSFKLKKILEFHGADVLCSDEYVSEPYIIPAQELIKKSDVIIVGVPHKAYASLSVPKGKVTIDLWNVLSGSK